MSLRPAHPMTRNDSTLWSSSTSGGRTLLASTLFAAALSSSALAQSNSIRLWGDNSSSQCTAIPTGMGIVTSLTGGNYHTVALNDAGTVFCWGRNTDGQSTVPAALGSAQAIAAGSYHTVALKTDGTVACWGPSAGPNFFGQCAVPAGLSGVVGVAAGWKHTIVLKSDGTIVGWGTNDSTQLTVPADVGAVTQLVAGARHNLARRSNGTVRAWGRNVELQAPASLTHTNVTAVAAGASHSVALIGDGTLRCWGSNLQGQCNGSSLTGVVGIAAGGSHTAALKADGSVVTFGLASSSTVPTVPPLGIATRVAAGGFHTGAIIAAAPTAVLVSTSPASCNDANGSIDVTVSLADTTSWTGPNGFTASTVDLVAVVAGQYTLTATGPGGSVVLPVTVAADPDLINPVVLSYTANLEASAGQSCTAPMANFASLVVASDNCSGAITVTQSPAAGAATALGVQAVTITVRDAAGNEVLLNATFTVTGHATLCFRDQDVDSFGNPSISGLFCVAPLGYVLNDDDCDDDDNYVHPGQDEECDGEDDDCDSFIDEDMPPHVYYRDADGDSFGDERISVTTCADVPPPGFVVDATDCNDESAAVHPGAAETCSDLPIDNNCNGSTSPSEANDRILFYGDADADGAGDPAVTQLACTQPTGFVANANDQCPNDGALQAPREYYRDFDGDTFGDRNTSTTVCSTVPPAGYVAIAGDCDDARLLYADTDGDGHGAGAPVPCGVQSNDDLCPDNAGLLAPITYYLDLDGDGYGNALVSAAFCSTTAPAGYTTDSTDCNDSSAATHPGAAELCADIGTDNNCNGSSTDVDANAADLVDFFRDFDNDNYSINVIARFCPGTVNAGYLATLSSPIDCNDNNAAINPGATEICDPANTDEDCDGLADNDDPSAADAGKTTFYADADSDTYSGSTTARFCDLPAGYEVGDDGDCNDNNPAINPGATEICDELNTDEDCDRLADNDDPSADAATKTTFYADIDADGFSGATTGNFCDLPDGYEVGNDGDCNDINAAINPGATEICDLNNTDEDCDGLADNADPSAADAGKTDFYADADSDTYSGATIGRFCDLPFGYELTDEGDCNDTDAAIHPGASERCNGLDDDCNSIIDDGVTFKPYYQDLDGDNLGNPAVTQSTCTGIPPVGFVLDNSDCDDSNAAIHGPTIFYADADNDGAGDPAFPEVACTQPVGFVANLNDACPANGDLIALATYYLDEDHDGFGVETFTTTNCESNPREGYSRVAGDGCPEDANKQAPGACGCGNADTDSDNDGTADCKDGCPNDTNKQEPGTCGCGTPDTDSDGNGTSDCADFVFTLDPNCVAVAQGNTLCVRVSSSWPLVAAPDRVTAVQLAVLFNQTRLRLDSVNNAFVGGPFDLELMEIIDNALGTLKYAAGIQDGSAGMTDASPIVELNFTVLPGVSDCDATGLLDIVSNIGPVVTRLTSQTGSNVIVRVPVDLPLPTIGLDFAPPTIAGLPEAITVPTDAGILFGGTVLEPTVTASDDCDAEVAVAMLITYPDLSISTVWPADNLFPRANGGVSTVQITATDDAGNFSVETLTITVGDYQHFNANLALGGAILGDSTRPIQLEIAGLPSADFAVLFVRANGAIVDFHVPVALGYGCATARDVTHSLRDAKTPAIVDREYSASFLLLQGNSNEDEQIDIFDFSLFVFDRVLDPVATNARSNFNADTFVTNADFTFLSINFFQVDETCDPGFTAPTPVTRVAVKELRRRGLGHLAAADFNGDGWVDLNDVQLYMQGAGPEPARPDNARVRPDLRPRW